MAVETVVDYMETLKRLLPNASDQVLATLALASVLDDMHLVVEDISARFHLINEVSK